MTTTTKSPAVLAFKLDHSKKNQFAQKLKANGLTSKAFINACIDSYLDDNLKMGLITDEWHTISINENIDDVLRAMKE